MSPKLILMIVADQVRADHVGFGGLPFGLTPNLDSIAEGGTVFDRAHVANPTCMPSRATLATGRWPSVHGTRTNGIPLDPDAETVMTTLSREGWTCAAVGKLHLQTMGWPFEPEQLDQIAATNPWSQDDRPDARAGIGPLDSEDLARHRAALTPMPDDYYGFSSVDLITGHGDGPSGHYAHWVREHGVDIDEVAGFANSSRQSAHWSQVWETRVPAALSTSGYVADRTVAQIEAAAQRDEPTFIFASFPDPHHPFCPPAEYASVVDPADLSLPATFNQNHENLPRHLQLMLQRRGTPHDDTTFAFAATEAQYREAMVAQLGLISMLDDAVGQMLAALERNGLADDAAIVFTADHGDFFGDHGLMMKHYVHYEAVTRVPLVINHGATAEPLRSNALVSNADVAPTILDLAGATHWRGIQGRSLIDANQRPRQAVLVEEDHLSGVDGLTAPVRIRTVITDDGRLTLYHGEEFGELYDHRVDAEETENRFGDAGDRELERDLRDRLLDEMMKIVDEGRRVEHGA